MALLCGSCSLMLQERWITSCIFIVFLRPYVRTSAGFAENHIRGIGFLGNIHVRPVAGSLKMIRTCRKVRHPAKHTPTCIWMQLYVWCLGMSDICEIHYKKLPCFSCRGKKGGSISSPKKSAANRAKSKFAANCRWRGRKAAEEME